MPINFSYWGMQSVAMLVTAILIPNFKISNPLSSLLLVCSLAFVNAHIWDTALFFKIPSGISQQALILIASNAALFWTLVKFLPGVEIKGLIAPIITPLAFTFISILVDQYDDKIDWPEVYKYTMQQVDTVKEYVQQTGKE